MYFDKISRSVGRAPALGVFFFDFGVVRLCFKLRSKYPVISKRISLPSPHLFPLLRITLLLPASLLSPSLSAFMPSPNVLADEDNDGTAYFAMLERLEPEMEAYAASHRWDDNLRAALTPGACFFFVSTCSFTDVRWIRAYGGGNRARSSYSARHA